MASEGSDGEIGNAEFSAIQNIPRVGTIVLVKKLGISGYAQVYYGVDAIHQTKHTVKALPRGVGNKVKTHIARFVNQARVFATIDNPHIQNVQFITREKETIFLVLEHIEGTTLRTLLKRTREKLPWTFPENLALLIAECVAKALVAIHERGVVHRDIRPANIVIPHGPGKAPDPRFCKLVDFGLAKDPHLDLTESNDQLGRLGFTAPEQIMSPKNVVPASDVYSLGAIFYTMLTGRRPFSGTPPVMIKQTLEGKYPAVTNFRKDLRHETLQLVDCCLACKVEDRFPSGAELLQAIQSIQARKTGRTTLKEVRETESAVGGPSFGFSLVRVGAPVLKFRNQRVVVVGRLPECHLTVPSSRISRRHAEFHWKAGRVVLVDLGSQNGTLINGRRIRGEKELSDGDEIEFGPFICTFRQKLFEEAPVLFPDKHMRTQPMMADATTGTLGQINLPELLQVLEFNRKTGTLEIFGPDVRGAITVRDGVPTFARCGKLMGEEAVFALFAVTTGQFTLTPALVEKERNISMSMSSLLFEAARRQDEASKPS